MKRKTTHLSCLYFIVSCWRTILELEKTKRCKGCGLDLPLARFNKHSTTKDGLRSKCIECRRLDHIKYREENPEKIRQLQKVCDARKIPTPEAIEKKRIRSRLYDKTEKGRLAKAKRYARWIKNGNSKAKRSATRALRRATKLKATPSWLSKEDKQEILDLFIICKMFQIYTGQEYHVDHIVPLQNEFVCGLHILRNLRVITATENLSKNNKFDESLAIDYTASAYC